MIDLQGYRANVGIVLFNETGRLFWCKRCGRMPGNFHKVELVSMSLRSRHCTRARRRNRPGCGRCKNNCALQRLAEISFAPHLIRRRSFPKCIGQKQRWFLLQMVADESRINLEYSDTPEFDGWAWVDYWQPMHDVVFLSATYTSAR